jgi:hypothetical protein
MTSLAFHHCRPLAHSSCATVQQLAHRRTCTGEHQRREPPARDGGWAGRYAESEFWGSLYDWIFEHARYRPLFLAVGESESAQRITCYMSQWAPRTRTVFGTEVRHVGAAARNDLLFGWHRQPHPTIRFMDFDAWDEAVLALAQTRPWPSTVAEVSRLIDPHTQALIWRNEWRTRDWLAAAAADEPRVQALVPALDLRSADLVRCRNQSTRATLISLGFAQERVVVERWRVESDRFPVEALAS